MYRCRKRGNIGEAFFKWRELRVAQLISTDAEMDASFLLDIQNATGKYYTTSLLYIERTFIHMYVCEHTHLLFHDVLLLSSLARAWLACVATTAYWKT